MGVEIGCPQRSDDVRRYRGSRERVLAENVGRPELEQKSSQTSPQRGGLIGREADPAAEEPVVRVGEFCGKDEARLSKRETGAHLVPHPRKRLIDDASLVVDTDIAGVPCRADAARS